MAVANTGCTNATPVQEQEEKIRKNRVELPNEVVLSTHPMKFLMKQKTDKEVASLMSRGSP